MISHHRSWSRLRLPLALLAALAGLLLAACGSDKKEDRVQVVDHSAQTRFSLGDPAPDFTLPEVMGSSVSLADYKDQQPVLLFFHMAYG